MFHKVYPWKRLTCDGIFTDLLIYYVFIAEFASDRIDDVLMTFSGLLFVH